jgi:hypothetical protein
MLSLLSVIELHVLLATFMGFVQGTEHFARQFSLTVPIYFTPCLDNHTRSFDDVKKSSKNREKLALV